ncbi:MAG: mRNA surveillance protein pelota [Candidatus Hydrothermarchaeota archaeon]
MKIIHRDLKKGRIKLRIDSLNDLWHLQNIIESGDLVFSKSYRRDQEVIKNKIRTERPEKKLVYLGIRVKNVDFHPHSNRLRILGVIEHGTDLGKHHTLDVTERTIITIEKSWKNDQLERLKEAEIEAKRPLIMVVTIDESEAEIFIFRQYGIESLGKIYSGLSKKMDEKSFSTTKKGFFREIANKMMENKIIENKSTESEMTREMIKNEMIQAIIICGPGFMKEDFLNFLSENYKELSEISKLEPASNTGKPGVHEIIKRGAIDRVIKDDRISKEFKVVESLLEEIGKGTGLGVYGLQEVERAVNYGAVDKLIVSDRTLREFRSRKDDRIEEIMENARKTSSHIMIISSEHEAGENLLSLGGIAALLRYKIQA